MSQAGCLHRPGSPYGTGISNPHACKPAAGVSARLTETTRDLEDDMAARGTTKTIDELLAQARAMLPHRPSPAEALRAQARGALLVDIRGDDQRRDGLIPGAIVMPRNSVEWRCDPASQWRHPAITRRDLHIILICEQGYQSSLAAATLQQLGLIHATDLDGGFTAWAAAGLPVIAPPAVGQDRSVNRHLDTSPHLFWPSVMHDNE
jgi:rhodanese-related sulfurtransferase